MHCGLDWFEPCSPPPAPSLGFGGEFRQAAAEKTYRTDRLGESLRLLRLVFRYAALANLLFLFNDWRFFGQPHFPVALSARGVLILASLAGLILLPKIHSFAGMQKLGVGWSLPAIAASTALVSPHTDVALFITYMFDLIKVPLFRDDGSRRGIVTVGRDITKQRETSAALAKFNRKLESLVTERTAELEEKAAELEQANARLLELDALKSSFVSSVSHEVRTPLTSILGFTRLIERDFHKHYLPLGQDNRNLAAKGNRIMEDITDRVGARQEKERITERLEDMVRKRTQILNRMRQAADAVAELTQRTGELGSLLECLRSEQAAECQSPELRALTHA